MENLPGGRQSRARRLLRLLMDCVVAIGLVFLAIALREQLDPLLADHYPFFTLFGAVIFVAWYGGKFPALLTLAVGAVAMAYFVLEPRYSLAIARMEYQVGLFLYLLIGSGAILLFDSVQKNAELQREIARRTAAEQRLSEQKELLRVTVASIGDGVISTDAGGNVVSLNAVAQALTGWTTEEAFGRPLNEIFKVFNETNRSPIEDPVQKVISRRDVVSLANSTLLLSRDGTEYPIDDSAAPILASDGTLLGIVLIFRDASRRRAQEEQLRQSSKMEAVGRLAGGVAHDFNNQLTVILGYTDLLLRSMPTGDANRDAITQIQNAGQRAASVTQQLLAFSRRTILQPRVLSLDEVVRSCETVLRRLIGEDIVLICSLKAFSVRVKIDPVQMQQALTNLALNARDAMPKGGTLTIETSLTELSEPDSSVLPESRPGRFVLLTVRDTGCGMNAGTRTHLFEPFFTTKGVGKGTGLGLAMIYGFVRQSEGFIAVDSVEGAGTTFRIYFPALEPSLPTPSGQDLLQAHRGSETILLVEDELSLRTLARLVLTTHGYTVLEAENGQHALEAVEKLSTPIHLLVTDVVMPRLGGPQLAERLRPAHPDMKILFMSGYNEDEVLRHGVVAQSMAFLQKPFTPKEFICKVREVLDGTG